MTSTPVTVSIILNGSQLDAGSLIQAERNEKAPKRIQKMMRARSTLDWSQSNNISCYSINASLLLILFNCLQNCSKRCERICEIVLVPEK